MAVNNKFKRLREIEGEINKHLFLICGAVTIIVMAMMVIQFFSRGLFPPSQISLFYLGVLIIYSLHKEMVRWLGKRKIDRQGEYFVYGWIALVTSLYLINFLTKEYFSQVALKDVSILTLEVLAVFILTRSLKVLKVILIKHSYEDSAKTKRKSP